MTAGQRLDRARQLQSEADYSSKLVTEHHFADVVATALCRRARRHNGSTPRQSKRLQSGRLEFTRTKSEPSRLGMANLQASRTKPRERDSYSRNPILPSSSQRCAKDD